MKKQLAKIDQQIAFCDESTASMKWDLSWLRTQLVDQRATLTTQIGNAVGSVK